MLIKKPTWLKKIIVFTFVLLLSVFVSCNQDSIFADIAVEPEPIDPRIKGSPSSIVELHNNIHVASLHSNSIHVYSISAGRWTSTIRAPDRILSLAATDNDLFVVTYSGNNHQNSILSIRSGSTWSSISLASRPQVIYGSGSDLYIGTVNNIIRRQSDGSLSSLNINADLHGAAGSFIATSNGVYDNGAGPISGTSGINITGIIQANGVIFAVNRGGNLLRYNAGPSRFDQIPNTSNSYTGAMAEWIPAGGGRTLLLLGVQGTNNHNRGYREINITNLANISTPYEPGTWEGSTVITANRSRYEASLARHSITSILQIRPGNMIFASTGLNGLWSFKLRDGIWGWNAED